MYKVPVLDSYEWQRPVITNTLSTPPISPKKGDRYIIAANPSSLWHNKPKRIAEYNGKDWDFTEPREGMVILIESENTLYHYIKNKWRDLPLFISGKRKISTHSESYNIKLDDAGKFFIADSSDEITFTLPAVSLSDLGIQFTFAKVDKNCKIIIKADTKSYIADSGIGCTIYNDSNTQEYTSITLVLIQPNRWGIVTGNGTWYTTIPQ